MAIYSCWIFDRHCQCVYSREWDPKVSSGGTRLFSSFSSSASNSRTPSMSSATPNTPVLTQAPTKGSRNEKLVGKINGSNETDQAKLLFGAIFSLRNIASKLYPPAQGDEGSNGIENYLTTFLTGNYRVHYFETATNWKFALILDPKIEDLQGALEHIYTSLFIEHVVKNALSPVDFGEGEHIENEAFVGGLDSYIRALPGFAS